MDLSGEVAKIQMRTDAKNLVPTARTIHLPEQKETNVRLVGDANLKVDFILIVIPVITFLSFAQQVILTVASWLFSTWTQNYEKPLE